MRSTALALALTLAVAPPGLAEVVAGSAAAFVEPASPPAGSEEDLDALLEGELLEEEESSALRDPIEPWNRGVHWVNRGLDRILFRPLARGYGFLMPDPGKRAVRRFFENLATPPILVNDLLQAEGRRALTTGTRFVVNTTVGVLGFFDPAASIGLERHESDFGQTLFLYGLGSGPYLMLPIFGPSTARDSAGLVVDTALRPDLWLLGGTQIVILGVGDGVSTREKHQEDLEELERSSIDFYAALRSVWWMNRSRFLEESRIARDLRRREAAEASGTEVAVGQEEAPSGSVQEADRGEVASP